MHDRGAGQQEAASRKSDHLFSRRNVYIIDDDSSVRSALIRFLTMKGMDVLGFGSAEDFLAERAGLAAGVLIVDVQLPGMSGLELLSQLVRTGIHWPAIVISGSHEGHEDAASRVMGPDRYLRKPFDPAALLRALHTVGVRS